MAVEAAAASQQPKKLKQTATMTMIENMMGNTRLFDDSDYSGAQSMYPPAWVATMPADSVAKRLHDELVAVFKLGNQLLATEWFSDSRTGEGWQERIHMEYYEYCAEQILIADDHADADHDDAAAQAAEPTTPTAIDALFALEELRECASYFDPEDKGGRCYDDDNNYSSDCSSSDCDDEDHHHDDEEDHDDDHDEEAVAKKFTQKKRSYYFEDAAERAALAKVQEECLAKLKALSNEMATISRMMRQRQLQLIGAPASPRAADRVC